MPAHLYVLSIGPVQDFIAAARRTRDLWFGSFLLSEMSKAAAKAISDEQGTLLIFPGCNNSDPRLERRTFFNVANIIRAQLPEGCNPASLDEKAKHAALKIWKEYADTAKKEVSSILNTELQESTRQDLWDSQVADVVEFNSAWVPLTEGYHQAQKRMMRLLGGRKSLRNFIQTNGSFGVEKSSLDGRRESVLDDTKKISKGLEYRLRLTPGEKLSAIDLVKRLGEGQRPFPSVWRVALDPWICKVDNTIKMGNEIASNSLETIKINCTEPNAFATGTGDYYKEFPFDGQVCYPSGLETLKRDLKRLQKELALQYLDDDLKKLDQIQKAVDTLQKNGQNNLGLGEPDPYFAILVADGDRMGKVISSIETADGHRTFSKTLATFAGEVKSIVENDHHGVLVFAGGEDIFAFLPLDTCLDAARCLHDRFGELLKPLYENNLFEGLDTAPTLSVGIAIGHAGEPLEDLLENAREAEKNAKIPDRNGLAIHLHTRSGGSPIMLRGQWKDFGSLDHRIKRWIELFIKEAIPDKGAYDLMQLAMDYKGWSPDQVLLQKDVQRLLKKKRADRGSRSLDEEHLNELSADILTSESVIVRAEELLVARRIAVAVEMSGRGIQGGMQP